MQYIALDAHKRYSLVSVEHPTGGVIRETRLEHRRGAVQEFLEQWDPGSPVVVETIGNWYWLVDEIEAAGMVPQLVHARKAKLMSGMINKTGASPTEAVGINDGGQIVGDFRDASGAVHGFLRSSAGIFTSI